VAQDLLVQALQGRGRVDPQLLGQDLSGLLEGRERLGLSARPVQRQHQLAPQPLPQRLVSGQPLQLGRDLAMATKHQQRIDPLLAGRGAQLLQPSELRPKRRLGRQVGQRRAPPQGQGVVKQAHRVPGLGGAAACLPD
jgi:hypothetical protein